MTMTRPESIFSALPDADATPPHAQPTRVAIKEQVFTRRRLLTTVAGISVAAGLGLLDLLPWSKPRAAFAAAYEEWSDCQGYWSSSTTCVPSSAYYDPSNCDGTWHRNDTVGSGSRQVRYTHNPTSCDGKNAWRWQGRGAHKKCSDGYYSYRSVFWRVTRFSICRTDLD